MTRRDVVRGRYRQNAQRIRRLDLSACRCRVIEEERALFGDDLVHAMPPKSIDGVTVLQERIGLGVLANIVQIVPQGVGGLGHASGKNQSMFFVRIETRPSGHRLIVNACVGVGHRRDWINSERIRTTGASNDDAVDVHGPSRRVANRLTGPSNIKVVVHLVPNDHQILVPNR